MKISIIIPAYNVENYLDETLLSISEQNFNDYEVIIVNDGSTDNTGQIIKKWKEKNNRIKTIDQENKGISYSRKAGLDLAIGEYVYFCDGDDMITPGALEFMYFNAKKDSLDILMCNAEFKNELINNSYGKKKDGTLVVTNNYQNNLMTGTELLEKMLNNREWRYAVWLYFVKRDLLKNVQFFEKFIHEDSAHNYQILNLASKVKYINRTVYFYRLREGSIMSSNSSIKNIDGYANSYNLIYDYNQKHFFNDETKYKFELRIFQQIVETYNDLDRDTKKIANKKLKSLALKVHSREYYDQNEIENLFKKIEKNPKSKNRKEVKDFIEYLELHVVDHCNLNCSGCCHFSPIAPEKFLDLDKYNKDLEKLSLIIDKRLKRLILMGGEPLLHPNIVEIIKISKRNFPYTDIQLLTNGILLNKMKPDFWDTCEKLNIQINISMYPINVDYISLVEKVKKEKIRYYLYGEGEPIKYFDEYLFDKNGNQNKNINFYNKCVMAKDCAYLSEGKIFPCQLACNIKFYNKIADFSLPEEKENYIDIFKVKNANEIYKFLAKPIPFCRFCDFINIKKIPWKRRV